MCVFVGGVGAVTILRSTFHIILLCRSTFHTGIRYKLLSMYLPMYICCLSLVCQCRETATQKCADTLKTMSPKLACRSENWRHCHLSPTCHQHVANITSQQGYLLTSAILAELGMMATSSKSSIFEQSLLFDVTCLGCFIGP